MDKLENDDFANAVFTKETALQSKHRKAVSEEEKKDIVTKGMFHYFDNDHSNEIDAFEFAQGIRMLAQDAKRFAEVRRHSTWSSSFNSSSVRRNCPVCDFLFVFSVMAHFCPLRCLLQHATDSDAQERAAASAATFDLLSDEELAGMFDVISGDDGIAQVRCVSAI